MDLKAFAYLDCWDGWLYVGFLFSLIILSVISVAKQCSWKEIFNSIWNFASIILSDAMIFARDIKGWTRILVMVWLLANTLLLSLFSGELFELIINGKIIDRIESKEELITKENWKSSKIFMADLGIFDFITSGFANNDSMAK